MHQLVRILAIASPLLFAAHAHAGPYGDDLSKCLVKATTPDDQVIFTQWTFAALSLHPAVSELAPISDEQRTELNKKAVALVVRVMTKDCRQQAIDAMKYEGPTALPASFSVFGQAAVRGLMSNPRVTEGIKAFGTEFAHDEQLKSLFRDAGIPPDTAK